MFPRNFEALILRFTFFSDVIGINRIIFSFSTKKDPNTIKTLSLLP